MIKFLIFCCLLFVLNFWLKTNPRPAQKPITSISKPQSNPTSQTQSKKVEEQKVIIKSEGDDIKEAFELFDANNRKINAREIRTAMQNTEKETTEDLRRVFNLYLDDPNAITTSLQSIKKVTEELGENIDELEFGAMLNKASKAGDKLIFEDLCISIIH